MLVFVCVLESPDFHVVDCCCCRFRCCSFGPQKLPSFVSFVGLDLAVTMESLLWDNSEFDFAHIVQHSFSGILRAFQNQPESTKSIFFDGDIIFMAQYSPQAEIRWR